MRKYCRTGEYRRIGEYRLLVLSKWGVHSSLSSYSRSASFYGLNLIEEPMFRDDFFADESTWAAVNAKYQLFDYAALHWAVDFSTCDKTHHPVQDSGKAISSTFK